MKPLDAEAPEPETPAEVIPEAERPEPEPEPTPEPEPVAEQAKEEADSFDSVESSEDWDGVRQSGEACC